MSFKTLVIFTALIFQHVQCASRLEIRTKFQPTLLRLRDLANVKYLEANHAFNILVDQLNSHQIRVKNATETQIANIRTIISDAKTSKIAETESRCLQTHETSANSLSTSSLEECLTNSSITTLSKSKNKFITLASVAATTTSNCDFLNPLETQLETFRQCLADKIPDLNRQISLVEVEYRKLSNSTLGFNTRCLADKAGAIFGQISAISYGTNICLL